MSKVFGAAASEDVVCQDLTVNNRAVFRGEVDLSAEFVGETLTDGKLNGTTTLQSGHQFSGTATFNNAASVNGGLTANTANITGGATVTNSILLSNPVNTYGAIVSRTGGNPDIYMGASADPSNDQVGFQINGNTNSTNDFGFALNAKTGTGNNFENIFTCYSSQAITPQFPAFTRGMKIPGTLLVEGEMITEYSNDTTSSAQNVNLGSLAYNLLGSAVDGFNVGDKGTLNVNIYNQGLGASAWDLKVSDAVFPRNVTFNLLRPPTLGAITVTISTYTDDTFTTPLARLRVQGGGTPTTTTVPILWDTNETRMKIELIRTTNTLPDDWIIYYFSQ